MIAGIVSSLFVDPETLRFDDIHGKLSGAFDIFNNYNLRLDVATFALVGLADLWAYLGHKIQINRRMIVPLLVLLLIYAAMPNRIIGTYGASGIGGSGQAW